MAEWATKTKIYVIIAVVIVIILIAVYYYGRSSKPTSTVTITNDQGGVSAATAADQAKATALAQRLYSNLDDGFTIAYSLFSDISVFEDLSAQSNVVFALTFSSYANQYNRSLLSDLKGAWVVFNTSVIDACIQRAQTLGILS